MSAAALSSVSIPSGKRALRLTRTLVVLSLSVVIAGGYAMSARAGSEANPVVNKYVTVVVAPGETLWSIASKFDGGDARSLVDQVITINSLASADVEAGQRIRIPLNR